MPDTVIDELREVRHQISASFGHDAAKLVAYLMQYQKQFHDRLLYVPDEISLDNQNRTPAVARCRGKRIKPRTTSPRGNFICGEIHNHRTRPSSDRPNPHSAPYR
jgi:hypothetical protein